MYLHYKISAYSVMQLYIQHSRKKLQTANKLWVPVMADVLFFNRNCNLGRIVTCGLV